MFTVQTRVLLYCAQFSGKLTLLLLLVCWVGSALLTRGRALKRIVHGEVANSLDDIKAYHFVSIRNRFACISNQMSHEVKGCTEKHHCGGTLFREDFVITAAHCVYWDEFYFQEASDIYNTSHFTDEQFESGYYGHFFDHSNAEVVIHDGHTKHAFYSNLALLAGSSDARQMEQIRHAFKKFIHPYYGRVQHKSSMLEHDVALVHVCEAFQITRDVRLAPMKPLNELTPQYEKIVKKSAACVYVGFGFDEEMKIHYIASNRLTIAGTIQMKYTWRQVACSSKCNWNRTLAKIVGFGQPRNPCKLCSDHIPPYVGTPGRGDSGGPIVCDGFYVAVIVSGKYDAASNRSEAPGYPLHCMRNAITPERLDYYRSVSEEEDNPTLGPVLRSFTIRPKGVP